MDEPIEFRTVEARGIALHCATAGPAEGAMVLLLHGFPESWFGWRAQIPALARAGFFVVAPDQRGYGSSGKPGDVRAYRLDALARDAESLITGFGRSEASVVGHDFGAAVAWYLASVAPERVRRLAILNVPHPRVMARALWTNPRQMLRSWYIAAVQVPVLPERVLRLRRSAVLAAVLRRTSRPGTFSDADLARYREAWSQPGAIEGMLAWYRALPRSLDLLDLPVPVRPPTLIIWGARDVALVPELARASLELCAEARLEFFPAASHWVQHEEAERVSELLVGFA